MNDPEQCPQTGLFLWKVKLLIRYLQQVLFIVFFKHQQWLTQFERSRSSYLVHVRQCTDLFDFFSMSKFSKHYFSFKISTGIDFKLGNLLHWHQDMLYLWLSRDFCTLIVLENWDWLDLPQLLQNFMVLPNEKKPCGCLHISVSDFSVHLLQTEV